MAQHEPQPEEGLLKPVGAAAQFAGSFVYSRAIVDRRKPGDENEHDKKPRTEASGKPEIDMLQEPTAWPPTGTEVDAPEIGPGELPLRKALGSPATEDDAVLACGELDAVAAQQRLQTGQVEPPPVIAPTGPALGPAL